MGKTDYREARAMAIGDRWPLGRLADRMGWAAVRATWVQHDRRTFAPRSALGVDGERTKKEEGLRGGSSPRASARRVAKTLYASARSLPPKSFVLICAYGEKNPPSQGIRAGTKERERERGSEEEFNRETPYSWSGGPRPPDPQTAYGK